MRVSNLPIRVAMAGYAEGNGGRGWGSITVVRTPVFWWQPSAVWIVFINVANRAGLATKWTPRTTTDIATLHRIAQAARAGWWYPL